MESHTNTPSSDSTLRGLQAIDWRLTVGVNLNLGGEDVVKTTIIKAIAHLLGPLTPASIYDTVCCNHSIEKCTQHAGRSRWGKMNKIRAFAREKHARHCNVYK